MPYRFLGHMRLFLHLLLVSDGYLCLNSNRTLRGGLTCHPDIKQASQLDTQTRVPYKILMNLQLGSGVLIQKD